MFYISITYIVAIVNDAMPGSNNMPKHCVREATKKVIFIMAHLPSSLAPIFFGGIYLKSFKKSSMFLVARVLLHPPPSS